MSRNGSIFLRAAGPRLLRAVCRVLPFAGLLVLQCASGGQAKNNPAPNPSHSQNQYVGSQACSQCHSDIYRNFSQTSMGRSMSLVTPQFLDQTPTSAKVVQERLRRRFEVS